MTNPWVDPGPPSVAARRAKGMNEGDNGFTACEQIIKNTYIQKSNFVDNPYSEIGQSYYKYYKLEWFKDTKQDLNHYDFIYTYINNHLTTTIDATHRHKKIYVLNSKTGDTDLKIYIKYPDSHPFRNPDHLR